LTKLHQGDADYSDGGASKDTAQFSYNLKYLIISKNIFLSIAYRFFSVPLIIFPSTEIFSNNIMNPFVNSPLSKLLLNAASSFEERLPTFPFSVTA